MRVTFPAERAPASVVAKELRRPRLDGRSGRKVHEHPVELESRGDVKEAVWEITRPRL